MKQPCGSTRRNRTVCLIDYVNYITDSTKPIDTAELIIIFVDKNIIRKILYEEDKPIDTAELIIIFVDKNIIRKILYEEDSL